MKMFIEIARISRLKRNVSSDNICLGCKKCDCDAAGMWNCTKIQQCRPDVVLGVNHRVLVEVMENLDACEFYKTRVSMTGCIYDFIGYQVQDYRG